jgi:hypothetical protein
MRLYGIYYRDLFISSEHFVDKIEEGYIYLADEIVVKGYDIKHNKDNKVKYIITTIKDDKIWIKRFDKWLQSERIKKLNQLGL